MAERATDVLVIGAGVFGLACAWACVGRGLRVIVAEAAAPGAGASGGLVGALAPHAPDAWTPKKAFQLGSLLASDRFWSEVAAAGGVDPGYARPGRLVPLGDARARELAEARAVAARANWPAPARWRILEADAWPGWLAPEAARAGVVHETLSARVDPRQAVAALAAAILAQGGAIRCGWRAHTIGEGCAYFDQGRITAGAIILAAGMGASALAPPLPLRGVKGQAAALAASAPQGAPILFADGVYVVPQANGRVAVGSTSEDAWDDPVATDARLDAVIATARVLCPALAGAPVIERWAGLRPRGARPDPMLGPLPGRPGVYMAAGGFKIGFGLAPAVGVALARFVLGEAVELPPGFSAEDHLVARDRRRAIDGKTRDI